MSNRLLDISLSFLSRVIYCAEIEIKNDERDHIMTKIDIGIETADREKIAKGIKHLLADSYTLYLQTHNFHWNVCGPKFRELHFKFA